MKQLSLFQGTPEDFQQPIIKTIQKEFEVLKAEFQPKSPDEYLGRQQVADMLHIDLSSVHNWRKKGVLKAYQIGGRVLFKRSEISAKIIELKIKKN